MQEPKRLSPKAVFWTQTITWSVLFLILAVRMPEPQHEVPLCPSVWNSLVGSSGIPKNPAGFALGVVAIGFFWWLSGLLSWVYTRWPRYFFSLRVVVGREMGPLARRLGPSVMLAGVALGLLLQLGCVT